MALNKAKCYYLLYGSNPSKSAVSVGRMTFFLLHPPIVLIELEGSGDEALVTSLSIIILFPRQRLSCTCS